MLVSAGKVESHAPLHGCQCSERRTPDRPAHRPSDPPVQQPTGGPPQDRYFQRSSADVRALNPFEIVGMYLAEFINAHRPVDLDQMPVEPMTELRA